MNWVQIGDRVLRYEVVDILGLGGQAITALGRELTSRQLAALRVLLSTPDKPGYEEEVRRFEQAAALRLNHPHVVQTLDCQREGTRLIQVQQYVQGEELGQKLARSGRPPLSETLSIFSQLSDGAEAIHNAGVIHRDLKPANVILGKDGHVTVIDLGICKQVNGPRLTTVGSFLGTIAYAAPEQILDSASCDRRTDVYALGVMLYECLVGRHPVAATTPEEWRRAVLQKVPVAPHRVASDVPRSLSDACMAAMTKRLTDRPGTAAEFKAALTGQSTPRHPLPDDRCLACGGRCHGEWHCPHCGRLFTSWVAVFQSGPGAGQVFRVAMGVYELGRLQLCPNDQSISRALWRVSASVLEVRIDCLAPSGPTRPTQFRIGGGEQVRVGQGVVQFRSSAFLNKECA